MMGRYPDIEAALDDYSGLDIQSIGCQIFEKATESRLRQTSHGSYADYVATLKTEEDELSKLLDLLLVPETWFFRDAGTFAFLTACVKTDWCARSDHAVLQILSAPCSTGEEPYSIAMTLLEAGLDPSEFRIRASDISSKALSAARAAEYAPASLRAPLTTGQARFFERGKDRSALCESVRSLVSFSQGNLVDSNFMAGSEKAFDIIFCKNLMIYLGPSGRARVMANLSRLLKENGLLFVGHSEVTLFHKAGYTPVSSAKAFALMKTGQSPKPAAVHPRRRIRRIKAEIVGYPRVGRPVTNQADHQETAGSGLPQSLLDMARSLADRGDLQEAAKLCRSLISSNSMEVGAYYLAGLIEESLDRWEAAEDFFLKAIYLDPDHYETLVQLCLLFEKTGDPAKAGQYRKRLRRLDSRG